MPGPTGPSPKMLGLLAALALALVFGAILFFARSPATNQPNNNDLFPTDPSEIPGFTELQSSDAMIVTMTDKQDPTRVAATLAADRFEPIGGGRRRLDHPIAWIYQRDGRAIQIEADTGTVVMPDPNQPPESGTLEGSVTVRSFDSTPAPGKPPNEDATPTMVTRFDEPVEFERQYLRLRSQGRFTVESQQIDFAGEDLTVMLNEVRDRIELIDIRKGNQLVIRPQPAAPKPQKNQTTPPTSMKTTEGAPNERPDPDRTRDKSAARVAQTPMEEPEPTSAESPAPKPESSASITRYHVAFSDKVLTRMIGTGEIAADSLDIWALLEDGKLRDNAIAQIALTKAESAKSIAEPAPTGTPKTSAQSKNTPATMPEPKQTKPETVSHNDGELVITWSGPLTVHPIEDDTNPPQLVDNDLAIEMNADEGNSVNFHADARGITGSANRVTYLATTGVLAMSSGTQPAQPIEITIAEAGNIRTQHIEASLTTGHIAIDAPGAIRSTPPNTASNSAGAQITWKEHAEFDLALNADGSLSDRLTHASFSGVVQGVQDNNQIAGSVVTATLDPNAPPAAALRKLSFVNGVLINRDNASLAGNLLDIEFAPGSMGYDLDPIRVHATDTVVGRTDNEILRAEELTVTLARDPAGKVFARTADASDNVRYTGKNRTNATADTLKGDGSTEQFVLLGTKDAPATVAQGGSTITGNTINLNARNRSMRVPGPGTFSHDVALDKPGANGHLRVRWDGSMRFDDALGTVVCEDSVSVVSTPDAYTKDTLNAHRIEIDISPMPIAEPIRGRPMPERELIAARAFGFVNDSGESVPAEIESKTYDTENPERVIGLLYLEGPQITADNRRQTLTVPAPGTLLVMDRSASGESVNQSSPAGPGLTRFTWKGRMALNRAAGSATIRDGVQVVHKSLTNNQTMTLTCDTLNAAFELASDTGGTNRLLNADALGTVVFSAQTRRLLADNARFDAEHESVFASGENNNLVTLYDNTQPAPVSARTLLWDLTKDRVEINAPTPVRTPSGP
ncbi:MAG: hypothetical protein KC996_05415 [Phycisphaerales bacterium]|nr:hypothetical protein [Phycisphaerales bacterium]